MNCHSVFSNSGGLPPKAENARTIHFPLAGLGVVLCAAALVFATIIASGLCASAAGLPIQAGAAPQPVKRVSIRYAKYFSLEYHGDVKELKVFSSRRDHSTIFTYILVPRGQKVTRIPSGAIVIKTPVRRMAANTTSCLPFLSMLHVEKALVGFAGCKLVSSPEIAMMIRRHQIAEIGSGGDGMGMVFNVERLYAVRPEMVMVGRAPSPKLIEAAFKPVIFADYMEPTPLGCAEWIKFVAAFFDKEAEAGRIFDKIADRYEEQAAKVRDVANRPTVFCAFPFRGVMYVPGGRSYVAKLIEAAGADYLWADDTTSVASPLSVEQVIERAKNADYWLDPGDSRSLTQLAGVDERFSVFKAFRTAHVYNNDAKVGPGGGNDFWETGEARPDLVLKDLISIFHPELLPSYRRIWYRRLPERIQRGKMK